MANDLVDKVKKLQEREAELESRRVKFQARLDVRLSELDRLRQECRDKFGVEIDELPDLINRQEAEINQGVAALDEALREVDAKLKSVEIS